MKHLRVIFLAVVVMMAVLSCKKEPKPEPKPDPVVPKVSLKVDVTELALFKSEEYALTVTVTPDERKDEVVFKSSDPSVVSVDSKGKVKAVNGGEAKVTVMFDELKQDVKVSVHQQYLAINGKVYNDFKVAKNIYDESKPQNDFVIFYADKQQLRVRFPDKENGLTMDLTKPDPAAGTATDDNKLYIGLIDEGIPVICYWCENTFPKSGSIMVNDNKTSRHLRSLCKMESTHSETISFCIDSDYTTTALPAFTVDKTTERAKVSGGDDKLNDYILLAPGTSYRPAYHLTKGNTTFDKIHYSTSDATVATVDETGFITAVDEAGDAVITMSTSETNFRFHVGVATSNCFICDGKYYAARSTAFYEKSSGVDFGMADWEVDLADPLTSVPSGKNALGVDMPHEFLGKYYNPGEYPLEGKDWQFEIISSIDGKSVCYCNNDDGTCFDSGYVYLFKDYGTNVAVAVNVTTNDGKRFTMAYKKGQTTKCSSYLMSFETDGLGDDCFHYWETSPSVAKAPRMGNRR